MKLILGFFFLLSVPIYGHTQTTPKDISPSRLQSIIDLPLNEAIKQRAIYKVPLKSAYARQLAMSDKACEVEANQRATASRLIAVLAGAVIAIVTPKNSESHAACPSLPTMGFV
jgi:hypothetical protein